MSVVKPKLKNCFILLCMLRQRSCRIKTLLTPCCKLSVTLMINHNQRALLMLLSPQVVQVTLRFQWALGSHFTSPPINQSRNSILQSIMFEWIIHKPSQKALGIGSQTGHCPFAARRAGWNQPKTRGKKEKESCIKEMWTFVLKCPNQTYSFRQVQIFTSCFDFKLY